MTKSTGTSGSIILASPPSSATAERIAAISTISGTPVKSCATTRAGLNGISAAFGERASQFARFTISASVIWCPS